MQPRIKIKDQSTQSFTVAIDQYSQSFLSENNNNGEVGGGGGLKREGGGLIIFLPLKRGAYLKEGGVGGLNRGFTVLKQSQFDTE